jgi:hypothetical protein
LRLSQGGCSGGADWTGAGWCQKYIIVTLPHSSTIHLQIEQLLQRYANHLMEGGRELEAVELYRKVGGGWLRNPLNTRSNKRLVIADHC